MTRVLFLACALSLLACSSDDVADDPSGDGDGDGAVDEGELPDPTPRDGGSDTGTGEPGDDDAGGDGDGDGDGDGCEPIGTLEHEHTSEAAAHVTEPLAPSEYNSSPPSSGPHCGEWGEYATFSEDRPLPACNFLHNLEHGAIVLLYNCPEGCPEIVETLEAFMAEASTARPQIDPGCLKPRLLLTPYADMDAKVAAVAWGYTWTSNCLDGAALESLVAFFEEYIGTRGDSPEPLVCGDGTIKH